MAFITPISQMRKLRLRDVKPITQVFPAGKWKGWKWAPSVEFHVSLIIEQQLRLRQHL